MKNVFLSLFAAFGIAMIPACSDVVNAPIEPQEVRSTYTPTFSDIQPIEVDGPKRDTVKKDTTERKKDTTDRGRKDTVKRVPPTIFGDLLVKLNLSPVQKPVVEKLLAEYRSCVENCTKAMRDAEAKIFAAARAQEKEIKKAVEAGTITKAQARERLNALKKSVNEQLKNLPIRANVQECIKTCDAAFLAQLERILTPEQKLILKSWLEARTKRGTSGGGKDTVVVNPRG